MLIDATHPEETRVVVLRNGRVEEFDYEFAARKLLAATSISPRSRASSRRCRRPSSTTAATATASWPSAKSIPTTIRSPSPTGRRCCRRRPKPKPRPKPRPMPRGSREAGGHAETRSEAEYRHEPPADDIREPPDATPAVQPPRPRIATRSSGAAGRYGHPKRQAAGDRRAGATQASHERPAANGNGEAARRPHGTATSRRSSATPPRRPKR